MKMKTYTRAHLQRLNTSYCVCTDLLYEKVFDCIVRVCVCVFWYCSLQFPGWETETERVSNTKKRNVKGWCCIDTMWRNLWKQSNRLSSIFVGCLHALKDQCLHRGSHIFYNKIPSTHCLCKQNQSTLLM